MKKVLIILMVCAGILALTACDSGGSSNPVTPAAEKTSYYLGGDLDGNSVGVNLDVVDSAGASRASATVRPLTGLLIYGEWTLKCSGHWDSVSGRFQVSSTGEIPGTMKMVFSLIGIISSTKITEARIVLTLYDGTGNLKQTYKGNLSESSSENKPSASSETVPQVTVTHMGYEGTWKNAEEHPTTLTLLTNSYIHSDWDNESNSYSIENGTLIHAEKKSGEDEWYLAYVTEDDLLKEELGYSGPLKAYTIRIVRAVSPGANQMNIAIWDNNALRGSTDSGKTYIATNLQSPADLADLANATPDTTCHFVEMVNNGNGDPMVDVFNTLSKDDLLNIAKTTLAGGPFDNFSRDS